MEGDDVGGDGICAALCAAHPAQGISTVEILRVDGRRQAAGSVATVARAIRAASPMCGGITLRVCGAQTAQPAPASLSVLPERESVLGGRVATLPDGQFLNSAMTALPTEHVVLGLSSVPIDSGQAALKRARRISPHGGEGCCGHELSPFERRSPGRTTPPTDLDRRGKPVPSGRFI